MAPGGPISGGVKSASPCGRAVKRSAGLPAASTKKKVETRKEAVPRAPLDGLARSAASAAANGAIATSGSAASPAPRDGGTAGTAYAPSTGEPSSNGSASGAEGAAPGGSHSIRPTEAG